MSGLLDTILTELAKPPAGVFFISPAGIELIKTFEGLRLTAYKDVAGNLTIGYGHTGPDVVPGRKIEEPIAERLLIYDLQSAEQAILKAITAPIHQHQFDAMVSLAYNIGNKAFTDSTLLRRINEKDVESAADEFLRWDKATVDGRKVTVAGLSRRRRAERALFMGRAWRDTA